MKVSKIKRILKKKIMLCDSNMNFLLVGIISFFFYKGLE